jgi:hypothetical protein
MTIEETVVTKYPKISQQQTEEFARLMGSDSNYPEYLHCSNCGVKIDYGNSIVIGDYIFCGDINHCSYHNNCRKILEEGE